MSRKAKEIEFKTEMVDLDSLKPHPENYQNHPEDQIEHLIKSIQEHGIYKNIVIAKDGTILAGHGTVLALKKMGYKKVPVHRTKLGPNTRQAKKILVGDNKLNQLIEQDDKLLVELLKDLNDADDLFGTGFDDMMLANLVMITNPSDTIKDFNAAAEWIGMPEYEEQGKAFFLNIRFDTEKNREDFLKKIKLELSLYKRENVWSARWPQVEQNDRKSIRFEVDDNGTNGTN